MGDEVSPEGWRHVDGQIFVDGKGERLLAERAISGELGPPEGHPCREGGEGSNEDAREFDRPSFDGPEETIDQIPPAQQEDGDCEPDGDHETCCDDGGVESSEASMEVGALEMMGDRAAPEPEEQNDEQEPAEEDARTANVVNGVEPEWCRRTAHPNHDDHQQHDPRHDNSLASRHDRQSPLKISLETWKVEINPIDLWCKWNLHRPITGENGVGRKG